MLAVERMRYHIQFYAGRYMFREHNRKRQTWSAGAAPAELRNEIKKKVQQKWTQKKIKDTASCLEIFWSIVVDIKFAFVTQYTNRHCSQKIDTFLGRYIILENEYQNYNGILL